SPRGPCSRLLNQRLLLFPLFTASEHPPLGTQFAQGPLCPRATDRTRAVSCPEEQNRWRRTLLSGGEKMHPQPGDPARGGLTRLEGTLSSRDGTGLFVRSVRPPQPKALVAIV